MRDERNVFFHPSSLIPSFEVGRFLVSRLKSCHENRMTAKSTSVCSWILCCSKKWLLHLLLLCINRAKFASVSSFGPTVLLETQLSLSWHGGCFSRPR